MSLTAAAKNVALDNLGITQLSLHSAYSTSGANEASGGSPAYARQNVTFSAASSGTKSISNQPLFNVPAMTVSWIGKWIGGTFAGMSPNGGNEKEFSCDISTNVVTCYAHGYANNDTIVFFGDTVPGGLTEGEVRFVTNATADTFTVAATAGGATIDITTVHGTACVVSKIVQQIYASQATHTVTAGSITLNA